MKDKLRLNRTLAIGASAILLCGMALEHFGLTNEPNPDGELSNPEFIEDVEKGKYGFHSSLPPRLEQIVPNNLPYNLMQFQTPQPVQGDDEAKYAQQLADWEQRNQDLQLLADVQAVAQQQEAEASWEEYLDCFIREEGYRTRAYSDSKGLPTIGIGHLLNKSRSDRDKLKSIAPEIDYDDLVEGKLGLDKDQIEDLFTWDLIDKLDLAHKLFPKFDEFLEHVQIEIVRGIFRGDIARSPKAWALIDVDK